MEVEEPTRIPEPHLGGLVYGTHSQSVQSTVGFIPSQPVSAFGESAPGRAIHERVHVLGTVCGNAVLPVGASAFVT